jgi:hypothetical protein
MSRRDDGVFGDRPNADVSLPSFPMHPAQDAYPWKKYPQAEAINAFARGIGAARMQSTDAAQRELARLQALRDAMSTMKSAYWTEQIDIQAEVVRGLMAFWSGRRDDGLAILAKAADREDATQKHVVTPGPILPAREVLAQTLLDADRAPEALREFEAVLAREPNRYRSFAGAAQAAQKAGDSGKAASHARSLQQMTRQADTPLPEIVAAQRLSGK